MQEQFPLPLGFRTVGMHCGIKSDATKFDLSLFVADVPCTAVGVFTQNRVCGAPVKVSRARVPRATARAVVINSGNANACTGERGTRDVAQMARLAAEAIDAPTDSTLILSTGVIGVFLPMDNVASGIQAAAAELAKTEKALVAAAQGILTTDSHHKLASRELTLGHQKIRITGMAKGSAMIGPNMATMLAVVMTDACLTKDDAQRMLGEAVDDTFNCISVEGHMSTNDSVLLLASGAAGGGASGGDALRDDDLAAFRQALHDVCTELAMAIPADGEGATHLVTINVRGCGSRDDAHAIAKTVAESALVKTAVAGADPNWGRIVSAAGYAGVAFDPGGVSLSVNGFQLFDHGCPVEFDEATVSTSIREHRETQIELTFQEGPEAVRFWTTDLTQEYVRLNADYRT